MRRPSISRIARKLHRPAYEADLIAILDQYFMPKKRQGYAADAILALAHPQPINAGEEGWRSMDTAPTDDTIVRLLVDYSGDAGDHPLEDDTIAWTIGFNSDSNTGEQDGWKFVGWCWTHDHRVAGRGKPIGWLPWNNPRTPDETTRSDVGGGA